MSVIYYKFKSHKDHKHISFEGHALSLFDLKCEIIRDNKLGKGTDFDLVVQNAQTNEEYKDDSDLIPRSTSVIVRRMPPVAPGKGTAQRYIKGIMGVVGGAQMATDRGGQLGGRPDVNITTGQASGTRKFGHQTLVNIPKPTSTGTASSATGIGASATPPMNLPNEEESEEMRIQAMFQQEKEQWQQQQAQMADATPIYRPGQRPRPNNAAGGSGGGSGGSGGVSGSNNTRSFQSYPEREPPPNYVCYRCGEKGHFIQHCPTNGDAAFDRPRIRRTTGIPKSFLKAIDKPTDKKSGVMVTDVGGFVVATPDSNAWEKHVAMHRAAVTAGDVHERMDAPPELACVICKGLMRDAVSTPCCDAQGCEECGLICLFFVKNTTLLSNHCYGYLIVSMCVHCMYYYVFLHIDYTLQFSTSRLKQVITG
ncbi:DWNN domain-containing protein [Syncephalis plumigaleata]|nr:DWNN domain-containing protein [Syncephalis plumigaleata]